MNDKKTEDEQIGAAYVQMELLNFDSSSPPTLPSPQSGYNEFQAEKRVRKQMDRIMKPAKH